MTNVSKIDFARVQTLMDVVHQVTVVAPRCTAILAAAMDELNALNDIAQKEREEIGKQRLAAEQEAAARLNEETREREEKERMANEAKPKPVPPTPQFTVRPGEPVADEVTREAQDPDSVVNRRV